MKWAAFLGVFPSDHADSNSADVTHLSNVVKAGAGTEDWRSKYLESLRSLESEERQFRAMEATLKRLAGRLCIASQGLSPRLDDEIKKLQAAIRREATQDELDQLMPPLTQAIHELDHAASVSVAVTPQSSESPLAPSHQPIIGDQQVRALLVALIVDLKRDSGLITQAEVLDAKLAAALMPDQLPDILSSLTEMVGQRIQRIEYAKQEVEALLGQMVGKLEEISQFVADQNQDRSQSLASSETLNTHLIGEMTAMGESVEAASDLQQTRLLVRVRLDSIGRHLQEFQQREAARDSAVRARNEQMAARVAELEAEAGKLHKQLQDEQRLSSIDVLTQVPNRMAYEKRIAEELQRWQRFKQPTCIAAWDVDHFKRINDTYGHRAGDRVLRLVAEYLADRIRSTDFVARYGGEEFVMILSGTQLDAAMRIIDEIRIAIAKLGFHFRGTPVSITISCGVTALLADDTSGTAFDRADKAMYQAKAQGRNRCVSV